MSVKERYEKLMAEGRKAEALKLVLDVALERTGLGWLVEGRKDETPPERGLAGDGESPNPGRTASMERREEGVK